MEIGVARAKIAGCEEDLGRGFEDEGGVKSGFFSEAVVRIQPGQRDAGHGLPRVFFLLGRSGDSGDGSGFSRSGLTWLGKGTGPPGTIWSEIEFKVA